MSTFTTAVFNTLIGLCTVFAVLIVISLIISLFKYIPALEMKLKNLTSGSKKSSEEERKPPQRPIIVEEESEEEEELVDDGELVAVIMAAIAASSGGAVSADKLVVRSIHRMRRNR